MYIRHNTLGHCFGPVWRKPTLEWNAVQVCYRYLGNFCCFQIFVVAEDYENYTHEIFSTHVMRNWTRVKLLEIVKKFLQRHFTQIIDNTKISRCGTCTCMCPPSVHCPILLYWCRGTLLGRWSSPVIIKKLTNSTYLLATNGDCTRLIVCCCRPSN